MTPIRLRPSMVLVGLALLIGCSTPPADPGGTTTDGGGSTGAGTRVKSLGTTVTNTKHASKAPSPEAGASVDPSGAAASTAAPTTAPATAGTTVALGSTAPASPGASDAASSAAPVATDSSGSAKVVITPIPTLDPNIAVLQQQSGSSTAPADTPSPSPTPPSGLSYDQLNLSILSLRQTPLPGAEAVSANQHNASDFAHADYLTDRNLLTGYDSGVYADSRKPPGTYMLVFDLGTVSTVTRVRVYPYKRIDGDVTAIFRVVLCDSAVPPTPATIGNLLNQNRATYGLFNGGDLTATMPANSQGGTISSAEATFPASAATGRYLAVIPFGWVRGTDPNPSLPAPDPAASEDPSINFATYGFNEIVVLH